MKTEDLIDFTVSSSLDPTEITVYTVDGNNRPTEYLLKKSRNAISANITTTTLEFNTPEEFATRTINATDLIEKAINNNLKVISYPFSGYWLDIGRLEDFEKAQKEIKQVKFK